MAILSNEQRQRYLPQVKTMSEFYLMVNILMVLDFIWVTCDAWALSSWYDILFIIGIMCNIILAIGALLIGLNKIQRVRCIGQLVGLGMLCLTLIIDALVPLAMSTRDYPIHGASSIMRIILLILLNGISFYGTYILGNVIAPRNPSNIKCYHMWVYSAAGVHNCNNIISAA